MDEMANAVETIERLSRESERQKIEQLKAEIERLKIEIEKERS